ncbi:MAG: MBOAT family O-acyltransferase [Candidatus Stygibacter australis]|nr:MBOAT family O-acyltransferase [Candidatus Stygibacter australis]
MAGIKIEDASDEKIKKRYLILSLCVNLGLLFFFKYFNFFGNSLNNLFSSINLSATVPELKVLLPIGISFYTFQTLSYTIDVYKGRKSAERHLGIFAVYVSFFPQLVAGPIERSTHLMPQFKEVHEFKYRNVSDGLKLMLWGFFKKLVIADRAAILVNTIYNNPENYHGFPLWVATYLFAFQIFCDFSAYSDIARGSAQVMGFDIMLNFRRPYFAHNIGEFWHNWHISLSTWFRDYVYIPLGGNRVSKMRYYFNIIAVFLTSGLWHGANWTFVFWGGLHGIYHIITHLFIGLPFQWLKDLHQRKIVRLLEIIFTFHIVCFAWIFFRANSLKDAFYVVSHLFKGLKLEFSNTWGLTTVNMAMMVIALVIMTSMQLLQRKVSIRAYVSNYPLMIRYLVYFGLIFLILTMGLFTNDEFIYFQF